MIKFYPIVVFIQVFCLYHAYSNKADQKWFWIIFIFPFIGSIFYLYKNVYSRRNVDLVTEEVKSTFVKNYRINKLERNLKFSNTVSNKIELADEHTKAGNYEQALELYESCREGLYEDDTDLFKKIIRTNYLLEKYDDVIKYGQQITDYNEFNTTEEKSAYAWSHHHKGQNEEAAKIFREMDIQFSNYGNRLEYIKFLIETKDKSQAIVLIDNIYEEIGSMDSYEKKLNRHIVKELKYLDKQLN